MGSKEKGDENLVNKRMSLEEKYELAKITTEAVNIFRMVDSRTVESWSVDDVLNSIKQQAL